MITITEQQVKELVNELIDLKSKDYIFATEGEKRSRNHGLELAIITVKGMLLKDTHTANVKYNLSQSLLKTA